MIARLRAQARPERPKRVRLVTGDYRWDRADWVRIHALAPALWAPFEGTPADYKAQRFADVDAKWDEAASRIEITAKNVAELDLDLPALAPKGPVTIAVGGTELGAVPAAEHAFVALGAGGPKLLAALSSRAGKKRHGVAGPMDDAGFHPLVFVYGTQRAAHREANQVVAEYFARRDAYSARYPVIADRDVKPEDLRGRSIVLIGGPESNSLTAKLAPQLPVSFAGGGIVVRGERFAGPMTGVSFVAPSPLDPAEYVIVHAGQSPRATLLARYLPKLAPDFVVWDERSIGERGELLLGKREVAKAGFWDDSFR
jgi:hypothetical protein